MYPNPQDVLPLPPNPSLEQYKKQAKDLVKACKSGDADAIRVWANAWIQNLIRLQSPAIAKQMLAGSDHWINAVTDFARRKLSKMFSLTDAQFVIARAQGFTSWPKFAKHIEALASAGSRVSRFEAAAEAIVDGDATRLKRLLRANPKLIQEH